MEWPRGFAVAAPDLVVRRRLVQRRPTSRSPAVPDLASDAEALVRARAKRVSRGSPLAGPLALALSLCVHALAGLALAGWLGGQRPAEPDAIAVVLLPSPAVAPSLAVAPAPEVAPSPAVAPSPETAVPPRPAPVKRPRAEPRLRARHRASEPTASAALEPSAPAAAAAVAPAPTAADAGALGTRIGPAPLSAFRLERRVAPVYPRSARAAGAEGTSLLRVHVTRSGRVDAIRIERSAGDAALDHAAESAVRRWRFAAPVPSEDPAGVWVLAPIEFRLR